MSFPSRILVVTALLCGAAGGADDLAPLSDEFDDASTLALWRDLAAEEGWVAPAYEAADINTTEAGRFHIVPAANTWFAHLRGLLFYKEVTGDFVATTRLRVLSRHNPANPLEIPNRSFSLTGIFFHGPRAITQAAPSPYTSAAVWPPAAFGSDYVAGTENYIFLSYGSAGSPGTRQFEIKTTRNSNSQLYYDSTGINQAEAEVWLQMVRVGNTVVCLRKHSEAGPWLVENRYPNPRHHFPDVGATLQVGITAYTDWPHAEPFNNGGVQTSYHFNYAPPAGGQRDLVSRVDYFRFRRPDPALTETVLQGIATSFDPVGNATSNPPVTLAVSPSAAPYLGENANLPYDPYGDWRVEVFAEDAALPLAEPGEDPDGDGLTNAMEFVLGGHPREPEPGPLPTLELLGGELAFRFTPAIAEGATLEVQASSELDGGSWSTLATRPRAGGVWQIPGAPPAAEVDVSGTTGEITVIVPDTDERRFLRLRIIL